MIAAESLSSQIDDVFSLLGVLLVFIIAFYSYLLTQIEALIAKPRPVVDAERTQLIAKVAASKRLLAGLGVGTMAILLLLAPLSYQVIRDLLSGPSGFPTSEVGLLLVDVFLVVVVVAIRCLWSRARRRAAELR
jgi:hypothetical protein